MLIVAGGLCQAYADTITTFDISGTVTPVSPKTGTTFTGNLVIDVTNGFILSGDLVFPDLPTLDFFGAGFSPTDVNVTFSNTIGLTIDGSVAFPTPSPFSLVGFNGATIESGDQVASFFGKETIYYTVTGGSITPETAAAPEPSSLVVLLGFGALIFAVNRKRLASALISAR